MTHSSFTATVEAHAAPYTHDWRNIVLHWGASPFPDVISLTVCELGAKRGLQLGLSPQAAEQLVKALLSAIAARETRGLRP